MRDAYICLPVRSAIARERGALRDLAPEELGGQVVRSLVGASGVDPSKVEDVIVGNQFASQRMGRHCALLGGLPVEVPGVTVNRACGSGLQAVLYGSHAIQVGASDLLIAGGVESYTRAPYLMEKPSEAYPSKPPRFRGDGRGDFGFPELGLHTSMGQTAENVAQAYSVTRADQDEYALESQRRAARAVERGLFAEEIVPIKVNPTRGEASVFDEDECPRPDSTLSGLKRLAPAFRTDGTVTAGNSCKRSDGASMMLLASKTSVEEFGLRPLGRFVDAAQAGVHPNLMGIGPVPAFRMLMERTKLPLSEISLIELNEAFAAQVIPVMRELKLPAERVNVNGGAIAFGHPIGATGAILITKLLYELRRRGNRYGVVTMCIGGGMGLAAMFECLA